MSITLTSLMQQRRDSAANWTANNPTLLNGELGYESDTGKWKVGDGSTAWTSLAYVAIPDSSGLIPIDQLLLPLGSASAPSLAFTGDVDSGLYSPGANQVALATNGTGRLFVDDSGRCHIGTNTSDHSYIQTIYGSTTGNRGAGTVYQNTTTGSDASNGFLIGNSTGSDAYVWNYENANTIFATNGTERLRITSDGKVGVGTSTPGSYLAKQLVVNTGATASEGITLVSNAASNSVIAFADGTSGNTRYRGLIDYSHATDSLVLSTAAVNALTIDSSQRVGIGTTSPGYKCDIDVTASALRLYSTTTDAQLVISSDDAANAKIEFGDESDNDRGAITYDNPNNALIFQANAAERMRIDSSGRLLVGTSSVAGDQTSAELVLQGASQGELYLSRGSTPANNGSGLGYINFTGGNGVDAAKIQAYSDGGTWANGSSHPSRLVFSTTADGASSPTERMRITSGGGILFNTVSLVDPATGTNNGLSINNDGFTGISMDNNSPLNLRRRLSDGPIVSFRRDTTLVGTISVTTTATAYNTSSDYRLKENVVSLTGAIDRVNQLQVHRFNFIADPSKTVDGFIAHEAQDVVPECVTGTKDEVDDEGNPVYQGIDQSKLVPLLTAALQEALTKIETLEARLTAAGI